MTNKKNGNLEVSNFAYDDAFRTMEGECDDIVIPFVNYVFGENYDKDAKIRRLRNEHFVDGNDGNEEKRITDSHFEIIFCGISKKYHFECESKRYDGSILIRFFEYDTQTALDEGKWDRKTLKVRFPHSGLLLLRGSKRTPDKAEIVVETPGGNVTYPINIIKVSDFSIDEIFDKHLYLLIPFYIFNYESQLRTISKDEEKLNELAAVYDNIVERLNSEHEKGFLSALSYGVIINMTRRVLQKLAKKHTLVQKKVGDAMGGKVLDLPEIRAYHQGKDEGYAAGMAEGEAERNELKAEIEALREEIERLGNEKQR